MNMKRLKTLKDTLVSCLEGQMTHLDSVDAKELGEVVDMVKDLEEAIYYCTITEAMEEGSKKEKYSKESYYDSPYWGRDLDRERGKMYYDEKMSRPHHERERPLDWDPEMRDRREGRSPHSRKMYIESKEMHHDKTKQMKELEKYMQELTSDILEMIEEATPEEKQFLSSKISTLATKIAPSK
jgi:hypothetical protein